MQSEKKFFPTITVLHIFQQVRVLSIHQFLASFPFFPMHDRVWPGSVGCGIIKRVLLTTIEAVVKRLC